jgi:AcrR family transcriptional regulator
MARKLRVVTRKSPRQARSRQMVEAILDATARVLGKSGYARLTTNQVAEVAGVSVGSLYQYFPSKEALVDAVLDRHLGNVRTALLAGMTDLHALPLRAKVRGLLGLLAAAIGAHADMQRTLITELPLGRRRERQAEAEQHMHQAIVAVLEAHRAELRVDDLAKAAFFVLVSVDAIMMAVLYYRLDMGNPDIVDETTALVVRYLTGEP